MHLNDVIAFFKPHKTVPITPWRAEHRWQLSPSRVGILFFGLAIFGLGDSLLVQGDVGNAPWTVFAQGLTFRTGLSIGWATAIISIFVLLIWIPLNEKPGFGTLSNIVLIAAFIEIGTHFSKADQYLGWSHICIDWYCNGGTWIRSLHHLRSWSWATRWRYDRNPL